MFAAERNIFFHLKLHSFPAADSNHYQLLNGVNLQLQLGLKNTCTNKMLKLNSSTQLQVVFIKNIIFWLLFFFFLLLLLFFFINYKIFAVICASLCCIMKERKSSFVVVLKNTKNKVQHFVGDFVKSHAKKSIRFFLLTDVYFVFLLNWKKLLIKAYCNWYDEDMPKISTCLKCHYEFFICLFSNFYYYCCH